MRQTANDVDEVKRESSPSHITLAVDAQTILQVASCERAFELGSLRPIRLQITISRATSATKQKQSGSFKVVSSRNGNLLAPYYGFTVNVCISPT